MESYQIRCIIKNHRDSAYERITHVGGLHANGTRWTLTQQEAVQRIEDRRCTFYVERPTGHRVKVIVARSATGHKYLKTEADGEHPNNLLALPTCP